MQSHYHPAQRNSGNFLFGKQLQPADVYCATIGVFLQNSYNLIRIFVEGQENQAAIFKNPQNNELLILYYPGKDNDNEISSKNRTKPLGNIIKAVNKKLIDSELIERDIEQAHHYFIVCESNVYFGIIPVHHFIKACVKNGKLTIEDSKDRSYDLSYIKKNITHCSEAVIKRGWQEQTDTWQCGHYVIAAIARDIIPQDKQSGIEKLIIDESIINEHLQFFQRGLEKLIKNEQKNNQSTDTNLIAIEDDEFDLPDAGSSQHTDISEKKPLHAPFFQRHPAVKSFLIGAGIGFAIVAAATIIVAAIVLSSGTAAVPFVFAAGAAVGKMVGLSAGTLGTGVGLATMSMSLIATVSGLSGLVTKLLNCYSSGRKKLIAPLETTQNRQQESMPLSNDAESQLEGEAKKSDFSPSNSPLVMNSHFRHDSFQNAEPQGSPTFSISPDIS